LIEIPAKQLHALWLEQSSAQEALRCFNPLGVEIKKKHPAPDVTGDIGLQSLRL